ncbi:MAG TPA: ABC transporter permease [Gemmatimonadaceae bacterium]|nr:ABC transporter permease [Gemmatimonadaceae bacterium]
MQTLKVAFRTLRKSPFVTTIAVVSLALGIGANAAMYSSFYQMLLQPIPVVPNTQELVKLGAPGPKPGSQSCNDAGGCDVVFSYPMFRDLEKAQTPFTALAAHNSFFGNYSFENKVESGTGLYVSGSYFPVLQLRPALGRLLQPSDDAVLGAGSVAVLSYAYWESRLGADSSVVGKQILVRGHPFTIVGVAPRGFNGITIGTQPKVFIPISMRGVLSPTQARAFERRDSYWVYLFARRKPGVSLEQARAAINQAYHPIITDLEAAQQQNMSAATLEKFKAKQVTVEPGSTGQSGIDRDAKVPLLFLIATTAIVLLIACANIANLLLARAANRSTELAVRLSLGARRGQLVRQLLTESFLLAALGGLASIIVARWTLALVMSLLPGDVATDLHLTLQPSAVAFAAVVALVTGFLFGLFPAIHSTRPDLDAVLRAGSGKTSSARSASRFRTILATAQIALSMALLMTAGLFLKSLDKVNRADLGLNVDNVVTFNVNPQLSGYDFARSGAFFARLQEEVAALPGVTNASVAMVPLLSGDNWGNDVSVQGFRRGPDIDANSRYNEIGPDYFKTVGATMLAGREFTESDTRGSPRVAVVNEAFARKFGLGNDAVGKFMGDGRRDSLTIQIVGLVKNAKYSQVKDPVPPVYYVPFKQDTTAGSAYFYVRTSGDPAAILRAIPDVVKKLDATLPVDELRTMPQQVKENVFLQRMMGTLATLFALLATLLASVGLYGVLAYSVAQRTREIGVRMALGADRGRVRTMVLRQVGVMALIGAPLGIATAIAIARGAKSMLFEMQGADPAVMAASVAVLTLVALAAGFIPALRASRVDPMQALRYE